MHPPPPQCGHRPAPFGMVMTPSPPQTLQIPGSSPLLQKHTRPSSVPAVNAHCHRNLPLESVTVTSPSRPIPPRFRGHTCNLRYPSRTLRECRATVWMVSREPAAAHDDVAIATPGAR